jgi:signal transduction histidine kinase
VNASNASGTTSRGASALSVGARRAAAALLAPAAGALVIGLQILALGHVWRRQLLPAIGPLEAPPGDRARAQPSASPRPTRAPGPAKANGNGNGHSGQNVTFAHELRRRLAALRVLSEAIERRTGNDDDVDRLVHLLVHELHDLEELESAMLGSSRRDTREEVDVLEVARAAAQTVGLARHSDITVQGTRRQLRVLSNPTMLRQALENLMDNAATCGAGRPVEVVVRFSMTRRLPGIEVLVADRGPGLGKTTGSMARRAGQGVGLPLVRRFVQESRGRLWCRNRGGGGAVFGLWLPVESDILARITGGESQVIETDGGHQRRNGHRRNGNGHGLQGLNGHNGNGLRRA